MIFFFVFIYFQIKAKKIFVNACEREKGEGFFCLFYKVRYCTNRNFYAERIKQRTLSRILCLEQNFFAGQSIIISMILLQRRRKSHNKQRFVFSVLKVLFRFPSSFQNFSVYSSLFTIVVRLLFV